MIYNIFNILDQKNRKKNVDVLMRNFHFYENFRVEWQMKTKREYWIVIYITHFYKALDRASPF